MAKPEQAKPRGRPSKWDDKNVSLAEKLSLLGLTDEEMANIFDVSTGTFHGWKRDYPAFVEALKKGKDVADADVVQSLYKRAMGYEHPEDDIRVVNGQIVITPMIKRYPPDTVAAIFWLKNRQRTKWRDKPTEDAGMDEAPTPVSVLVEVRDARKNAEPESTAGPVPKPAA